MFSVQQREALSVSLIEIARSDPRISGIAITGSASLGNEDRWSDVDLAFGVSSPEQIASVLEEFTRIMFEDHQAVDTLDVVSGDWIYRVFLLSSTLQVDLAFVCEDQFRARAPSFKLIHGRAMDPCHASPETPRRAAAMAWLYALHVRSCIERGKLWQAESMLSAMRDQVLGIACLRHGLNPRDGRGFDALPPDVLESLSDSFVGRLTRDGLSKAFASLNEALARWIEDPVVASTVRQLSSTS